jgi:uncharacterized protein YndB with AHSA1/START domain
MNVNIENSAIVGEIDIAAPPEAVFQALTDPEQLAAWWGDDGMYRTHNWQIDLRVGGLWSCDARNANGNVGKVHGRFLEVQPPTGLAYTWNPSWDTIPETHVRFKLRPTASGTRVEILHDGFGSNVTSMEGHTQGWTRVLGWLDRYVAVTA